MVIDVAPFSPEAWNIARFDPETGREYFPNWPTLRSQMLAIKYEEALGADLAAAQLALLNRIITLQVWCEMADWRFKAGKALHDDYTKNSAALARLLKEAGLIMPGKTKPKGTNLASYLAGKVGNDVATKATPAARAG